MCPVHKSLARQALSDRVIPSESQVDPAIVQWRPVTLQQVQRFGLDASNWPAISAYDTPPGHTTTVKRHHPPDEPRPTDSHKLGNVAIGRHLAWRNLLNDAEYQLDVTLVHHQLLLPSTPLNGPTTAEVIQPP